MTGPSLLYRSSVPVTDDISVVIPKVGDVIDREDEYYTQISILTAMPMDYILQLDELGLDVSEVTDYELFLMLFDTMKDMKTDLIFGDLDISRFERSHHIETGAPVLYDEENDIVIDRVAYTKIASFLRQLHHLEKNNRKPANGEAKKFLLDRAKKKAERNRRKKKESQIEPLIIAMVNTEQFKYGYEETRGLSIYQFNESVRQILHKVDYDNKMHGIYAGTIDPKHLSQDDLNWVRHK